MRFRGNVGGRRVVPVDTGVRLKLIDSDDAAISRYTRGDPELDSFLHRLPGRDRHSTCGLRGIR